MKRAATSGSTIAVFGRVFASTLGLVILLRELGTAWSGAELLYVTGLGVWLLCVAAGVAWRVRPPFFGRPIGVFALALFLPLGYFAARWMQPVLIDNPGLDRGIAALLLSCVLVLLPSGLSFGLMSMARPIRQSLGVVGGGVVAALLPMAGVHGLPGILAASLVLLITNPRPKHPWSRAVFGLMTTLVIASVFSQSIEHALTRRTASGLVMAKMTAQGRLVLTADSGLKNLMIRLDNAPEYRTTNDSGADDLVLLAVTQHPKPRSAAVLGGLLDGYHEQLVMHGVQRVVRVQPDRHALLMAGLGLPQAGEAADLIISDPRRWLAFADERRDIILCALPEPLTVRSNRFWTHEFADLCARRLQDGGVLALQMHTGENVWTLPQARRIASIYEALDNVFADVAVLPGPATVMLAANRSIERDPSVLTTRLGGLEHAHRREHADILRRRWYDHRTVEAVGILAASSVPPNTDLRPVCLADDLLRDLGSIIPGLGWREAPPPRIWLTPAILGGVILVLWLRRRGGAPLHVVASYAGLSRAILAGTLLLYHQTQQGTIYRDLGFLLALVGSGHLGGILLARARLPGSRSAEPALTGRAGRWRLPVLLVLLSLWSFMITLRVLLGSSPASTGLWLVGTGLMVSLVLMACADRRKVSSRRLVIADLVGGGAGALLAGLLLLPFHGLAAATLIVTVLAFPAALSVWPLPGGNHSAQPG